MGVDIITLIKQSETLSWYLCSKRRQLVKAKAGPSPAAVKGPRQTEIPSISTREEIVGQQLHLLP